MAGYKRVRIDADNVHAFFSSRGLDKGTTLYCVMPWVGTKAIMALLFYFQSKGLDAAIFSLSGVTVGIMISDSNEKTIREVYEQAKSEIINVLDLPVNEDAINLGGKFDDYIEPSLLKKEFLVDCLDAKDSQENMYISQHNRNN